MAPRRVGTSTPMLAKGPSLVSVMRTKQIGRWWHVLGLGAALAVVFSAIAPAALARATPLTATWSGRVDWTQVYDPSNPPADETTAAITWQYRITVRPTASGGQVVGRPSLQVSGTITDVAAPPNQGLDLHGQAVGSPGRRRPSPGRWASSGTGRTGGSPR